MTNPKKTPKSTRIRMLAPAVASDVDILDSPSSSEFTATILTKPDQSLLRRTMRFLVNILEPGLAERAWREGYSREEHALGWQLWRSAAGETRPFDQWLREQQLAEGLDLDHEEQRRRLQEIDEFENTWFPRTRAIIRRVVDKERRDAFAAAFFKDLVQQPLGPTVVGSVGTYLTRLAGLESSTDPDAKVVWATLRSRGLTNRKLAAVARLIQEAKGGKGPSPTLSMTDLEKARREQMDALESLRDWWNDWSVTLRPRYGVREQLKLGLTLAKKRGPSANYGEIDDEDGEPAEEPDRSLVVSDSLVAH